MISNDARQDDLRTLVTTFYGRVREDDLLGPVFERRIGDRWEAHLDTMVRFWSSILYASGDYHGHPVQVHQNVPEITSEHFDRWIEMWRETALEVLPKHRAEDIIGRSMRMRIVLERHALNT